MRVLILIIIAVPLWIIWGPFFLIYKAVEELLQPYLLKKAIKDWNEEYEKNLKKGICIDYPPTRGSLIRSFPLKWLLNDVDDDEII